MAHCELASKPLSQCLRQTYKNGVPALQFQFRRSFATAKPPPEEPPAEAPSPFYRSPHPALVTSPRLERRLIRQGRFPIGSRRRRAALQGSDNIPFELLPYQCFQEARNVIKEDRDDKLKQIETERTRLAALRAAKPEDVGGERQKQVRIVSIEKYIEKLKILADSNDPLIKKRFEDGLGDMTRPIYRFLADRKWREYRRLILVQRIEQMRVVPDVLGHIDPIVDVKMLFARRNVQPGQFVDSRVSAQPPELDIQSFDKSQKLVTIAVVDADVPVPETDGFTYRNHFLAVNVPISNTETSVPLAELDEKTQVVFPWLPPHALKGSPYHRLAILIMEQKDQKPLDKDTVASKLVRDGFTLRTLESRHKLKPIGAHLFRNQWDDNTADVMKEHGFPGADTQYIRRRIPPLRTTPRKKWYKQTK